MKIQISSKGLRIRLSRNDFAKLAEQPLTLGCEGWDFTVIRSDVTHLVNWPVAAILQISGRDFNDLCHEPENGIVLNTTPQCEIDVDQRDKEPITYRR